MLSVDNLFVFLLGRGHILYGKTFTNPHTIWWFVCHFLDGGGNWGCIGMYCGVGSVGTCCEGYSCQGTHCIVGTILYGKTFTNSICACYYGPYLFAVTVSSWATPFAVTVSRLTVSRAAAARDAVKPPKKFNTNHHIVWELVKVLPYSIWPLPHVIESPTQAMRMVPERGESQ